MARLSRIARIAALLAASGLIHGGVLGAGRPPQGAPPRAELARKGVQARSEAVALAAILGVERADLVARARADRAAGRLELGEFLLRANALDAREQRAHFDLARAQALYAGRLARLREAPADDLRRAIPAIFADLRYYGRPGGRMGDALLKGGGSCEPLAHLLAATIHDAGYPERAALRYYGGETSGVTHLAPIYPEGDDEYDLLAGGPVTRPDGEAPSGVRFAASELIEIYARAHGLLPPVTAGAERANGGGDAASPAGDRATTTMTSGYPANADPYPGALPIYAGRAVQDGAAATATTDLVRAENCAFFVRTAVLDPPRVVVDPPRSHGTSFAVEVRRVATAAELDRTFAIIHATEEALDAPEEPTVRALQHACLAALYDRAATDLALASEPELAAASIDKRRRAEEEGAKVLAAIDYTSPAGVQLLSRLAHGFAGRSWLLLLLRGGDDPVLRLARDPRNGFWGRITALAALVVAPATRAEATTILEGFTRAAQVEVMHEICHAHDHVRPWVAIFAPALEPAADERREFFRAYRVFRAMAWGLWQAGRPLDEVLAMIERRAREEGLDHDWQASLLEYYGRNALALHRQRGNDPEVERSLKRWLRAHGFAHTELFRVALADVKEAT